LNCSSLNFKIFSKNEYLKTKSRIWKTKKQIHHSHAVIRNLKQTRLRREMDFQALFMDIPMVTRTYLAGCVLTTAACATGIISPFSLYFSVHMIFVKGQVWRLITNFLYFGSKFGLDFFFHMFFLTRYARSLEQETFAGRKADFAWMLMMGAGIMLLIAPLASLPFLGNSLTFMLVYLWSRRNPFTRISFLGFFNFTAPYLPWVLLGFSMLLENDVKIDLLGILVGHLYYFSRFVYPEMTNNQIELFKAPHFMRVMFMDHEAID